MPPELASRLTEDEQRRLVARMRRGKLATLKWWILYGVQQPGDDPQAVDPTLLVRSALIFGVHALGFHCEPGYHDEMVAHALGCEMVPSEGYGGHRYFDPGRLHPWQSKEWRWQERPAQLSHRLSGSLAPRGSGKSLWLDHVLSIWYALRYPNIRQLITSKTQESAVLLGNGIRSTLEHNASIRAMFGELAGKPWGALNFNLAGRTRSAGAPSFTMRGIGGQIAGLHFDRGALDDVSVMENSRTEGQREKLFEWMFQTALPTIQPESDTLPMPVVDIMATRYHPADIHHRLPTELPEWRGRAYERWPAILPSAHWLERNASAVAAFETEAARAERDGELPPMPPMPKGDEALDPRNWRSLWQPKLPLRKMLHMMSNWPRAYFHAQYLNDARLLAGKVFQDEMLQWVQEDRSMARMQGFTGWDLAISVQRTADFTAGVHIKLDTDWEHPISGLRGRALIWWTFLGRVRLAGKLSQVLLDHKLNHPSRIAIESNAAQALFTEQPELTGLPVEPALAEKDKLLRAATLVQFAEQGRLFFVRRKGPVAKILNERAEAVYAQFLEFPDGTAKKDGVDAAAWALDLAARSWYRGAAAPAGPDDVEEFVPRANYDLSHRSTRRSR